MGRKGQILLFCIGLLSLPLACSSPHSDDSDRYIFSLDLKADSSLMEEYLQLHTPEGMWPEIPQGIRNSGCLDMEIYRIRERMFLLVEIEPGAHIDSVWKKMGQEEKQAEWASFVRKYQQAIPGEEASSSWVKMEKIYDLDDYFDRSMD